MCHSAYSRKDEVNVNLRELRNRRGLKVNEVAKYLCCSHTTYSRYESGERVPSIDTLLKLSKLYHVSIDYIVGNEEIVGTSLTPNEVRMINAMRMADERSCQDALLILELHRVTK